MKNEKKRFLNTYKFSNHDTYIFILLLQKDFYLDEYMGNWGNSVKHHCLNKKIFKMIYTWKILLMQVTILPKKICKDFKIKDLGKFGDLYVQTDTLLLGDAFENYKNK